MSVDVTAVTAERTSEIHAPMQDEEIALCQRIFDEICLEQNITDDEARDKLAANIIISTFGIASKSVSQKARPSPSTLPLPAGPIGTKWSRAFWEQTESIASTS